ncbi:MAG: carboxypeptidase-like regulatory domain-containing protein, partial [Bryobacteraceae bacterium]
MQPITRSLRRFSAVASIPVVVLVLSLLLAVTPTALSQSVTGQISGTVADPAGAVVVGAKVQLTHDLSQQVRDFTTETNGGFI